MILVASLIGMAEASFRRFVIGDFVEGQGIDTDRFAHGVHQHATGIDTVNRGIGLQKSLAAKSGTHTDAASGAKNALGDGLHPRL